METIKNFLIGLLMVVLSFFIFIVALLTWPLIVGIGSALLSLLALVLFVVLVFYIIVLIGYLVRQVISKRHGF